MPMYGGLIDPNTLKTQGATSPVVRTRGYAPEVMKLAAQLTQERAKAGIGAPKAPDPGVLGRIFDVIQRPLYASANFSDYLVKGKNPLEGVGSGLWGTEKTTYDKVLEDMGMSGGWQRSLLGMGLDIGLDPTTYLAGGALKGITKVGAEKLAVEGAIEAAEKVSGKSFARMVNSEARDILAKSAAIENPAAKALETAGAKGFNVPGALTDILENAPKADHEVGTVKNMREAINQAKEAVRGNIYEDALARQDKILAENKGKMILKFMGKPIPGMESEALYGLGTKAGNLAKKIPYMEGIGKAFRPTMNNPYGLNDIIRAATGRSIAEGDDALARLGYYFGDAVRKLPDNEGVIQAWGGLNKDMRKTLMHSMETGSDISMHAVEGTGRTLDEYKGLLEKLRNEQFDVELNRGIRKISDQMENMVPHIYQSGTPEEQAAFRKGRMKEMIAPKELFEPGREAELAAFNANRNVDKFSLQAARDAGLNPIEDALDAFSHKTIKSFQKQAKFHIWNGAHGEFGVDMGTQIPKGIGQKQTKALAEQMGLKRVYSPYFENTLGERGAWFPNEIADAMQKTMKTLDDPAAGSDLLKLFDKVQNTWKLSMTAVNPGHHIRNFSGDVFLNFLDGVTHPMRYMESARIIRAWKKFYPDANAILKVGNKEFTAEEVMRAFTRNGGKSGFFRTEFSQAPSFGGGFIKHPIESIRQGAELREDWTRLAHFIDVLKKEGGHVNNFEDLMKVGKKAGQRVRKFNIDYGDLTPFERRFMKRIVPFYTWMRKNIPLQLETLALDPGKISTIPKGLRALQNLVGATPEEEGPLGLNMVPKWLREMGGVRIAGEGLGRNQIYWNPSMIPFMDIGQYTEGGPQGMVRQFLGSTTPIARTPIEYASGQRISTGAPMGDTLSYAQSSLLPPSIMPIKDIATGKGEPTDWGKLLGLGIYNVGPQQQLGELKRQQDIVQAILKSKKPKRKRSWE